MANIQLANLPRDIIWTGCSFLVLAASGVLISVAIVLLRDAAALGVFNQAYAVYIIASQLAIGGVHFSVLRGAALHAEDPFERGTLLVSGLVAGLVLGSLLGLGLFVAAPALGRALESSEVGLALGIMAFGLPLFSGNKIFLSYLNGLRLMPSFSVLQGLRYIVLMIAVIALAACGVSSGWLALGFPLAELITCAGCLGVIGKMGHLSSFMPRVSWIREHASFGIRSFLSGVLIETNSRIDILVIGYFLSDRSAGIYSVVALLFDGLYQLLVVVRTNFNPALVAAISRLDWRAVMALRSASARYVLPAAFALSLCIVGVFVWLSNFVVPSRGLQEGLPALVVLLGALSVLAMFLPFENLLLLNGFPGHQSLQYMIVAVVNLVLSIVLVPKIGITGAALASALGYAAGVVFLLAVARRCFGWDMILNKRVH